MVITLTEPVVVDTSGINRLRALLPEPVRRVEPEQVLNLIDYLSTTPWWTPESLAKMIGVGPDELFDLVRDLGTWLGQALGSDGEIEVLERNKAIGIADTREQPFLLGMHSEDFSTIVLPSGFERQASSRELDRAVANIVMLNAQIIHAEQRVGASTGPARKVERMVLDAMRTERAQTVHRWLLRRYHHVHQVVTYAMVAGVHRVAQLGRLGDIEQLVYGRNNWCNRDLARVLVEAFDLLDIARLDALDAIDELESLVGFDVLSDGAVASIRRSVSRARWVSEGDFRRLEVALERSVEAGRDIGLSRDLAMVVRRSTLTPEWRPATIADMVDGQVQRIAEAAGLDTAGSTFADESRVRTIIAESGQSNDADLLFPDGLRVIQAGLADEFARALERRATGDFDWADELNRALGVTQRVHQR